MNSTSPRREFAAGVSREKREYVEVLHAVRFVDKMENSTLAKDYAENLLRKEFARCRIASDVIFKVSASYFGQAGKVGRSDMCQ